MIGWENRKHMDIFVLHISLLEAHYLIFPSIFHPCYNSCISIEKIVYFHFEFKSKTTTDFVSSHLYKNVMICKLN